MPWNRTPEVALVSDCILRCVLSLSVSHWQSLCLGAVSRDVSSSMSAHGELQRGRTDRKKHLTSFDCKTSVRNAYYTQAG